MVVGIRGIAVLKYIIISLGIVGIISFLWFHDLVPEDIKKSAQFRDGKFRNVIARTERTGFGTILKMTINGEWGKWPTWVQNSHQPKLQADSNEVVVTFVNHATFLAEIQGVRVLFDPIFSKRASPVGWAGPRRRRSPGIDIDNLPPIDLVVISHNHYDHLDIPTLRKLVKRFNPMIVVPLGNKKLFSKRGIKRVTELDWWGSATVGDCTKVTFVPAQHFSGRGLLDGNQTLWGGFVVQNPAATIYHAGDTGYSPHFKEIGDKFAIDIALLPIGDYRPSGFLYYHMNPEQAVQAHKDLGAKHSFSMHSETFPLSAVNYAEPEEYLRNIVAAESNIAPFSTLGVGESFRLAVPKVECKDDKK